MPITFEGTTINQKVKNIEFGAKFYRHLFSCNSIGLGSEEAPLSLKPSFLTFYPVLSKLSQLRTSTSKLFVK